MAASVRVLPDGRIRIEHPSGLVRILDVAPYRIRVAECPR